MPDGLNYYAQINPPSSLDSTISFTLPFVGGQIATNNTAVMLSGNQTIGGDKVFNGQILLNNQRADFNTSALNRRLGDDRYGAISAIIDDQISVSSTNFLKIVEINLQIGRYQIDAFLASLHTIGVGCKIRFSTTKPIMVGITDNYGRPSVAAFSWPIIDDGYSNISPYSVRSDATGTEYRRTITGIIEILENNTQLSLDYAQLNLNTTFPSIALIVTGKQIGRAHV